MRWTRIKEKHLKKRKAIVEGGGAGGKQTPMEMM